jgi:hypothetical protein
VTTHTPQRPSLVDELRDRSPIEAPRDQEALIKEARRRARRPRQRYAALALLGVTPVLAIALGRVGGHSHGRSTAPGTPAHAGGAETHKRKPDRSCAIGASWSADGTSLAFFNTTRRTPGNCAREVMTVITSSHGRKIAVVVTPTVRPS